MGFKMILSYIAIISLSMMLLYLLSQNPSGTNIIEQTKINNTTTNVILKPMNYTLDAYSTNHKNMLQDSKHKLMYCFIAKNANTLFRNLFNAILKNDTMINRVGWKYWPKFPNNFSNGQKIYVDSTETTDEYNRILNDSTWQKLVIIRDPLERLLSGFLNKCFNRGTGNCEGGVTKNFTLFVVRMINKLGSNGSNIKLNHHFIPQHLHCDLSKTYKYYNHVILYNIDTIAVDTLNFLKSINLTEYYNHWGEYHNETMFNKPISQPSYNATKVNKNDLYKQWFKTKAFAMKCIEIYYKDYMLFNLSTPGWVNLLD